MEYDIEIRKINDTWMKIDCREIYMEMEISDRFSFLIPDHRNHPQVKRRHWDGIKRLYNRTYKRMYVGLLVELVKFIKKQEYSLYIDPSLFPHSKIEKNDIENIIKEVIKPYDEKGLPINVYDYQIEAIYRQLNTNRSVCLAATSAGKSLIFYIAIRIYQMLDEFEGKPIILIVPSKLLVEQMYNDFCVYSNNDVKNWNPAIHCQKIDGDYSPIVKKQIIISTWQSLKNISNHIIQNAGAIFVDEVHTANGPVLTKHLENAVNVPIRHGMTGTLDDEVLHELQLTGLFGPIKRIVASKEIIDQGRATPIHIKTVILDYDERTKLQLHNVVSSFEDKKKRYATEVDFINKLESRKKFIIDTAKHLKGNTIILFDRVDSYGVPLYEEMKKIHKNTFLIVGEVGMEEREDIKNMLENIDDGIVFATTKILSTGVSIKRLHNMIFISSTKAKIKLLQSIGRLMRLHETKKRANFIDIVDKLDYKGIQNYVLGHVYKRVKYYSQEGHPIKFITINLKENA
jgi:superfamily II DNA or RNA helicase